MHLLFQHPLSNRTEPESIAKIFELRTREGLREDVGEVLNTRNVIDGDFIVLDAISDMVVA